MSAYIASLLFWSQKCANCLGDNFRITLLILLKRIVLHDKEQIGGQKNNDLRWLA